MRKVHLFDPAAPNAYPNPGMTCCGLPTRRRAWVSWSEDGPQPTCQACIDKYPLEIWRAVEGMGIMARWLDWMYALGRYCRCRVCDAKLTDDQFRWALRKYEQQLCSDACRLTDLKRHYACCMEAVPSPCVCMHSFSCKTHGDTHVGTHD